MFLCDKCLDKYEGKAVSFAQARGPVSRGRCEDCGEPHSCYELFIGMGGVQAKPTPETAQAHQRTIEWPDPTPEMLQTPQFEAIWECIKTWDINVPGAYGGYCGATGNHVRAIMDALTKVPA